MRHSDARQKVLHACRMLTDSPTGGASYAGIQEITGLSLAIVKDHAHRMRDAGELTWVANGFYRVSPRLREQHPVCINVLHDGSHRIRCGDREVTISKGSAILLKMACGNHGTLKNQKWIELDDEVFLTVLLDGSVLIECGDQVLELSSIEARLLRAAIG